MSGTCPPVAAAASMATLAFLIRARSRRIGETTELVCSNDEMHDLLKQCAALLKPYWPSPLHWNGLITTALTGVRAMAVPPILQHPSTRESRIKLSDGGTVSLDWWPTPSNAGSRPPVVLLLPGFGNSSRTIFVRTMMSRLCAEGFQAVAMNFRGMGHLELTSARIGMADSWRDFPEVLNVIESATGGADVYAVGFSMGGVALLLHLAEHGMQCGIKAAVTLSSPIDYAAHGGLIKSDSILNFTMAWPVKLDFLLRRSMFGKYFPQLTLSDVLLKPGLTDVAGDLLSLTRDYEDVMDFFEKNNPAKRLQRISCPVLILQARDDPVIQGAACTPYDAIRSNPNIIFAETSTGGHIGWAGSRQCLGPFDSSCWADAACTQFLKAFSMRAGSAGQLPAVSLRSRL